MLDSIVSCLGMLLFLLHPTPKNFQEEEMRPALKHPPPIPRFAPAVRVLFSEGFPPSPVIMCHKRSTSGTIQHAPLFPCFFVVHEHASVHCRG